MYVCVYEWVHLCVTAIKKNLNSILLPAVGILTVGMPDLQSVDVEDDDAFSHPTLYKLMLWLFLWATFQLCAL